MIEVSGRVVPCGQCMPCRINKQRFWTGRILLEAAHCPCTSSFLTLTYEKEPEGRNLVQDHTYDYYNLIRTKSGIGAVRFFTVGEYGDKTGRPHYHMALFNVPPENFQKQLTEAWPHGFVQVGTLEQASAAYISKYCTKKMTAIDDLRLDGRSPEFARMSKRPPLGAAGITHIGRMLETRAGHNAIAQAQDVPSSFRIMGKSYPIGIYWRNKLREDLGITNPPVNSIWDMDYEAFTREQEKANKVSIKLWQNKGKRTGRVL